jgi:hypothetical protein
MDEAEHAVQDVIAAWVDEGVRPEYHRRAQENLKRTWPSLAYAIEYLVEERRKVNEDNT